MLFQVWYVGAIATLLFLWGGLTVGRCYASLRNIVKTGGGYAGLMSFSILLAVVWPVTMVSLLRYIHVNSEAK